MKTLTFHRCVAPDMRGYGDSDKPKELEEYHISKLRDDVRDLVKGKVFVKTHL